MVINCEHYRGNSEGVGLCHFMRGKQYCQVELGQDSFCPIPLTEMDLIMDDVQEWIDEEVRLLI